QLVATQKKELIKEFASLDNKVYLCSDIWSDHWQSCSYMGITCHWIDNAWNIQKYFLAYRCFNDPHTAQNISHLIFIILEEYIFHIRCTCHIFNLCVQDNLKSLELYIRPIRSAIHTHPQVMKQLGKFCKINGMRPIRFSRDVPTRWNSTYKLLLSTFEYKIYNVDFWTNYSIFLMAKEILACHVSTVAVEHAFSMGGNTLDERRSTIRPKNLEAQCLLNDWSRAASRTQDSQNEPNDDEDTDDTSGTTTGGGTSD
ncbi:hypothetical protein F511_29711, partial [Dorcoceras hygrometricum]